jgi:hypothetical protein
MADQHRFDYLRGYGQPHLHKPDIDVLVARGVRLGEANLRSIAHVDQYGALIAQLWIYVEWDAAQGWGADAE